MDLKKKLARLLATEKPAAALPVVADTANADVSTSQGTTEPSALPTSILLSAIEENVFAVGGDQRPAHDGFDPDDSGSTAAGAARVHHGDEAAPGIDDPLGIAAIGDSDPRSASIRSHLMALAQRKVKPRPKAAVAAAVGGLLGAVRTTPKGDVHVVAQHFAPTHVQGTASLKRALEATGAMVAKLALDPRLASIDFSRALFFDTETTGLAGGTGTIPFLIGMAWYDGSVVHIEQLVLRKPGEEGPMLELLRERIANASCIVSYNGKSFDWPLLRTRYVLNRLAVPEPAAHVDLLHCARRVYRRRLTCVQLTELERQILGMYREGDIGGAEIPAVYTEFLRGRDGGCLTPILTHNVHDLISLVALLGVLADKLEQASSNDDVRDQLSLAELSVRAGDRDRAHAFASTAAAGDSEVSAPALALIANMHKRRGEYASAVAALERAVLRAEPDATPKLHLELAKLYERHLRNPARALEHAYHSSYAESSIANKKRLKRLSISASKLLLPLDLD